MLVLREGSRGQGGEVDGTNEAWPRGEEVTWGSEHHVIYVIV